MSQHKYVIHEVKNCSGGRTRAGSPKPGRLRLAASQGRESFQKRTAGDQPFHWGSALDAREMRPGSRAMGGAFCPQAQGPATQRGQFLWASWREQGLACRVSLASLSRSPFPPCGPASPSAPVVPCLAASAGSPSPQPHVSFGCFLLLLTPSFAPRT